MISNTKMCCSKRFTILPVSLDENKPYTAAMNFFTQNLYLIEISVRSSCQDERAPLLSLLNPQISLEETVGMTRVVMCNKGILCHPWWAMPANLPLMGFGRIPLRVQNIWMCRKLDSYVSPSNTFANFQGKFAFLLWIASLKKIESDGQQN